jgi:Holliday junction resolvasome RuvABC ATP-dependent DNA helicase subunit
MNEAQVNQTAIHMSEFVGQNRIRLDLCDRIIFARKAGSALPHLLLSGAAEMGKCTLARAVAYELGVPVTVKHSRDFSAKNAAVDIFSNIRLHQVLVVEDVELLESRWLRRVVEIMDDFRIEIIVGVGRDARAHNLPMPKFTLIGLTSSLTRVDTSFRRWCVMYEFDSYTASEIGQIVARLAESRGMAMTRDAAMGLAAQCANSPGNAAVILKRIERLYGKEKIGLEDLPNVFSHLGLGEYYPSALRLQDTLRTMGGREFEHWSASLFRGEGYAVQITQASGDHGIDLILTRDGRTTAVQCKRWTEPVGEPILRDFYGAMMSAGVASGIVATTSTFTPSARAFVQNKPIRLIELDELLDLGKGNVSAHNEPTSRPKIF